MRTAIVAAERAKAFIVSDQYAGWVLLLQQKIENRAKVRFIGFVLSSAISDTRDCNDRKKCYGGSKAGFIYILRLEAGT